jgi:hypothetical protein
MQHQRATRDSDSPQAVRSALAKATPSHSVHTARKPPLEKKPPAHLLHVPVGVLSP